jgi:hypothetical protein
LTAEAGALRERVAQLVAQAATEGETSGDAGALQERVYELELQTTSLQADVHNQAAELDDMRTQNAELQGRIADLEVQLADAATAAADTSAAAPAAGSTPVCVACHERAVAYRRANERLQGVKADWARGRHCRAGQGHQAADHRPQGR